MLLYKVSICTYRLSYLIRGQARHKVVKFRGVGIADKEVVDSKGEGGGMSVVSEEHRGGGFRVAVLG